MADAARDPTICDKVYDLFAKRANSSGPDDAIDTALKPIEDTWMQKTEKAKRRDPDTSSRVEGEYFSAGITDAMPTEIKRLVALLQVFHGIVLSFPFEMSEAWADRRHASRLNRCTQATSVPMDLRMVLVALAARWCVLFADAPKPCKSMAYIVDSFYQSFGKFPGLNFLPSAPLIVRKQDGWTYPPPVCRSNDTEFMYMPTQVQEQLQIQIQKQKQKQQQQQQQRQQRDGRSPYSSISRHTMLSDEHQATMSQISLILPRKQEEVTQELLERMESRSQELAALSSMLVDNLVSLPADENPNENDVIRDIMHEVNRLYEIVSNYISVLSPEHTVSMRRLRAAIEESRRSQWLYRDTVNAFEDPVRSDEEGEGRRSTTLMNHLLTIESTDNSPISAALDAAFKNDGSRANASATAVPEDGTHKGSTAQSSTSAASSSLCSPPVSPQHQMALDNQAECSKAAAARIASTYSAGTSTRTSGSSPQQTVVHSDASQTVSPSLVPSTLQRVSTKVRGKMPDLGTADNLERLAI
ncbi:hypothetical protein EV179_000993 [Coemansia sp. RSA 487]|nr:hypothetical protein EV179_000993 [Coemansia sp. RSA 487]